jgi:hypothetical protein
MYKIHGPTSPQGHIEHINKFDYYRTNNIIVTI